MKRSLVAVLCSAALMTGLTATQSTPAVAASSSSDNPTCRKPPYTGGGFHDTYPCLLINFDGTASGYAYMDPPANCYRYKIYVYGRFDHLVTNTGLWACRKGVTVSATAPMDKFYGGAGHVILQAWDSSGNVILGLESPEMYFYA